MKSYLTGFSFLVALWTFPTIWDLIINDAFRFSHLRETVYHVTGSHLKRKDEFVWVWRSSRSNLEAAGVDDLVADGALHEREAELLLLRLHRVLLSRFTTRETHGCVGQHRLEKTQMGKNKRMQTDTNTHKPGRRCVTVCVYYCLEAEPRDYGKSDHQSMLTYSITPNKQNNEI